MPFNASVVQVATVEEKEKLKEKLEPLVGGHAMCIHGGKTVYNIGTHSWRFIFASVDGDSVQPHSNTRKPT